MGSSVLRRDLLVFTDYCALPFGSPHYPSFRTFTFLRHDSIGVGEDGPTHEPVETVSSVRLMPNIDVIRRPIQRKPQAHLSLRCSESTDMLALTRQTVRSLNDIDVNLRREGALRGGYIAKRETGKLDLIIMSCAANCSTRSARAGRRRACRLHAMLRTVQSSAFRISRRSFA